MIFVTVGTLPFDRLVRAADELAALVDESVIIQRGSGSYAPRIARCVDYVDQAQMEIWLCESRIVVAHSGIGSIIDALRSGKPLILVPRKASLGEHFDDHQLELAGALAEQGRAVVVDELSVDALVESLAQAEQLNGHRELGETSLHAALRAWLAQQAARPPAKRWRLFRWIARGV